MSELLGQHRVVALDTCVWICHLEGHPDYRGLTSEILTAVSAGKFTAVVSELTLMELLVRPLQLEREDVVDEHEALLTHFPNVSLVAIRREILLKAAALRARYGLRIPDAIIVATGILHRKGAGADTEKVPGPIYLTNDISATRDDARVR